MTRPLPLLAPAKINLYLRVLSRRPDGYHEIESLFCPVGLYDRLQLTPDDGISISCDAAHVPSDEHNLAHRAAICFFEALERTERRQEDAGIQGVHIDLEKQIPVGAGLGGGSSDAASVLKGLNQIFGGPFDDDRLRALALTLGADVPFFIAPRTAIATGIGERLEYFTNLPKYWAIIIFPNIHIATAEVYKKLKLRLTKHQKEISNFHFTGQQFDARRHLVNDLETVTERHYPEIKAAKSMLRQKGALGALMSGSGSSVFGLFSAEQKARQAMAALPSRQGWRYYLAPLLV
ncbi:MAG: 4-(cytidine 5'-diphospho)-2-C-methyl-D-erythritol kinase [Desulfosarcinaceae bacterium]|jgi:4-diphosphocytidyl-2-C-methyl-D-erythritol kinase